MLINGYDIVGELKNDNSGYAKWGFGKKGGKEYFIKEFLSPVYPVDESVLSSRQIEQKQAICLQFENEKRSFYSELNKCITGNIVTINDFFRSGSKYYMVTEKIDAVSIDPVAVSRFDYEQKMLIVKVLLHCLNTLHRNGIVHGDIKPNNILFKRTKKGLFTAKLIDFDSSFLESAPPVNVDDFQGDMVYLAPESFLFIAEEVERLDSKIDVFALGVLFHQYFCGDLPGFDHTKYDYAFEAVLDGCELVVDPRIPDNVASFIHLMLNRDPLIRPSLNDIFTALVPTSSPAKAFRMVEIRYITSTDGKQSVIKSTMGRSMAGASPTKTGSTEPTGSFFRMPEDL